MLPSYAGQMSAEVRLLAAIAVFGREPHRTRVPESCSQRLRKQAAHLAQVHALVPAVELSLHLLDGNLRVELRWGAS